MRTAAANDWCFCFLQVIDLSLANYMWRLLKGAGKHKDLVDKYSSPALRINIVRSLFAFHRSVTGRAQQEGILGGGLLQLTLPRMHHVCCVCV